MTQLKPCLWCSQMPKVFSPDKSMGRWGWLVSCENDDCPATCETQAATEAEAIAAWNHRDGEAAAKAEGAAEERRRIVAIVEGAMGAGGTAVVAHIIKAITKGGEP